MNPTIFRPMLAAPTPSDLTKLPWPMLASPKLDGIRGIIQDGKMYSRSLKLLPSEAAQTIARQAPRAYNGFEGELISDGSGDTFSIVMTRGSTAPLKLHVFENTSLALKDAPFSARSASLHAAANLFPYELIQVVPQTLLFDADELAFYEDLQLQDGREGVMLRHPDSPYKYGRSTARQAWMVKVVRFTTAEARITGFNPIWENQNVQTTNALGLSERSHYQEGKVSLNTLGSIDVEDLKNGWRFSIGTGFTEGMRKHIWDYRSLYQNQILTYKSKEFGQKILPRQPVFVRFRHKMDM